MATTRIFSNPRPQFRKDDGTVNSNGRLYFRVPGANTTTLKNVYSDSALTIPYSNPVILDSVGRAPTIYLDGDYNVQETTSGGSQLWRVDNYQPVAFEGQYNQWSASLTYAVNDIVQYTNGKYYVSLQSSNLGRVPSGNTVYWSEVFFITVYNASETYGIDDVVYYSGKLYTSLQASNIGNTPSTSFASWNVAFKGQFNQWSSSLTYDANDIVRYTNEKYYVSLQASNTGQIPVSAPLFWSEVFFLTVYNSSDTYGVNEVVYYDGNLYKSLQASNTGNTPDTSFTFWKRPGISVPPISGYQGYVISYVRSGAAYSSFNISSNIASDGIADTIGPTGSGADHIWTALDSLPANAVGVRLSVEAQASRTTGVSDTYSVIANIGESGVTNPAVAAVLGYGSVSEPSRGASINNVEVIVDADGVFSASWTNDNVDTSLIVIYLTGFLVEEL